MTETYVLNIVTPVASAALNGVEEFEVEFPGALCRVYVSTETYTDGNPDWGMPFETATTVTVAAEVWRDGMNDDGDGEPVTTPEGIAALLGCSREGLAAHLDEMMGDRWLTAYEARCD